VFLGPNPVVVTDPSRYDPRDGDGMLHAVEIRDGSPVEQRSRLIVTRHLVELLGARAPSGPLEAAGPVASRALAKLASRLVALDGEGLGYRVGADLTTACVEDFDATLATPMGTQVLSDPASGDAWFLGVDPLGPPWLRLHRLSELGIMLDTLEIEMPSWLVEPALGLLHDRVLIAESSIASPVPRGDDDAIGALRFDPGAPTRLGSVLHDDLETGVSWATMEPGHVVCISATRQGPDGPTCFALRSSPAQAADSTWWPPGERGYLERLAIDDSTRSVDATRLDDLVLDSLRGDALEHAEDRRFLYAVTATRPGDEGALLVKYDVTDGSAERRAIPEHLVVDEPQFIRDPEGHSDEEGWVVLHALDRSNNTSQLIVLDATGFTGRPTSVVTLPTRLPTGIRGLFLSPEEYR
jgi:carotenoid cleavage dioxygenase